MLVKIIGFPCARVEQTMINASAAADVEEKVEILRVSDIHQITRMGGIATPTVIMNERVKSSGRIPSVYEITGWIMEELAEERVRKELEEEVAA